MIKKDFISFIKAFIVNPRTTGALVPSSKLLAHEMASHVIFDDEEVIVELGAGTGAITQALIESGISQENIIVIEYSHDLVAKLRTRFPTMNIIEGDAIYLTEMMQNEEREISSIISSLPLRSLPKSTTQSILRAINAILPIGSKYIQFTYGYTQNQYDSLKDCELIFSKRIWRNLPPARVDVWIKKIPNI